MYQLKSALVLGRTPGSQWEEKDVSEFLLLSAYLEYRKFFLILKHPSTDEDIYVDMEDVKIEAVNFNGTVKEWLRSLGNQSLPHSELRPDKNIRYVRYVSAEQAMYRLKPVNYGVNYASGSAAYLKDIKIDRPQFFTDLNLLKNCLFTVNGFIHDSVADSSAGFILKGSETAYLSKEYHVGILNFNDLGNINRIKINKEDIRHSDLESPLYERLRFNVDVDLTNKSYFLVLGGYLVMPKENVFFQSGEKTFTLVIKDLDYELRYLESRDKLNMESLEIDPTNNGQRIIDLSQLRSDRVIKNYLTLSQSFLVVVDTPTLQVERNVIQRASFPGQFLCPTDPVSPLIGSKGKILDYWKTEEDGQWSIISKDTFNRQFIYTELDRQRATYATDALDTTRRYDHSYAYFLEISTVKE